MSNLKRYNVLCLFLAFMVCLSCKKDSEPEQNDKGPILIGDFYGTMFIESSSVYPPGGYADTIENARVQIEEGWQDSTLKITFHYSENSSWNTPELKFDSIEGNIFWGGGSFQRDLEYKWQADSFYCDLWRATSMTSSHRTRFAGERR